MDRPGRRRRDRAGTDRWPYGRTGDTFHFYDINPQVVAIARTEFTFCATRDDRRHAGRRTPHARARAAQAFDVLAIDAFSSDSIPIHLLTTEAMSVYLRHMRPDGVVAFHVSNRFFDLPPVVKAIAAAHGLSRRPRDNPDDTEMSNPTGCS